MINILLPQITQTASKNGLKHSQMNSNGLKHGLKWPQISIYYFPISRPQNGLRRPRRSDGLKFSQMNSNGLKYGLKWPKKSIHHFPFSRPRNGLRRPRRSDLTSSVPPNLGSRNIFYFMIYPRKLLPSMSFLSFKSKTASNDLKMTSEANMTMPMLPAQNF